LTTRPQLSVSLWVRLMKTHSLILAGVRRSLQGECTLPQFDVMAQLHREKAGLTSRDLSRRLLVSAGNLTGILARLESDGLVRREIVPHDRRSSRVLLTPLGRRRMAGLIERHAQDLDRILAPVRAADQARLRAILGRTARALENGAAPARFPRPSTNRKLIVRSAGGRRAGGARG
jgi:DNA-binding MarR family transcriptional regulator